MVTIRKTGEGSYLVSLAGIKEDLGRNDAYLLKKEVMPVVRSHWNIEINIKGVKSVDNGAMQILRQLASTAERNRCNLRFTNIDSRISKEISGLNDIQAKPHGEFEYE